MENEFDCFLLILLNSLTLSKMQNCKIQSGRDCLVWALHNGGNMINVVKTKMVSAVSSNKAACSLYVFRMNLAKHLIGHSDVDVKGTIVGQYTKPVDIFKDYCYSIAIENKDYLS